MGSAALEPALKAAIAARERANVEGDTSLIESLMASEYVQTDIGGRVQTRSEWLASYFKPLAEMIRAGDFRWKVWEETDVRAFWFGDTVVVVGKLRLEGEGATFVPGRDWVESPDPGLGPATLNFTRVWIERWREVATGSHSQCHAAAASATGQGGRLPNMRVQRTRPSPSAPHSPLTRYPLGAAGRAWVPRDSQRHHHVSARR